MQVTVLLLTLFLSDGGSSAITLQAPDAEQCELRKPTIIEAMYHQAAVTNTDSGEKVTVKYVDGFCHTATEGKNA